MEESKEFKKYVVIPAYVLEKGIHPVNGEYISKCGEYDLKDEDYPKYAKVGMEEQAKRMGLDVFDITLPHYYVNKVRNDIGMNPVGHVVWCYYPKRAFGEPVGITAEGRIIVSIMKHLQEMEG